MRHFGLPAKGRSGNHLRGIPPDWTILLGEQETAAIAHASGLDVHTVTCLTLAHYDQRALRINFERRYVNRWVLWGRGCGSRFCPDCLKTSGGRWQLAWRLGWAFACPMHHRLLADCCPNCGRVQRQRPRSGIAIPRLGICGNPPSRPDGAPSGGCGFDLTQTRTLTLPTGHPALTAQDRLLEIIDSGTASFGAYELSPQPAQSALTDIRAIGGRVLADLPDHIITSLAPSDLTDRHFTPEPGSRLAALATERPGFMAPPRVVSTAVAAIMALRILEHRDIHQGGEMMRGLLDVMRDELYQISATSLDSWGRGLSPVLNAVHLAALAPSFRPSEQLRYRTATDMPSRPKTSGRAVAHRARKIPSMFWPSWTVRLAPSEGVYPRVLALVLASSLLIIGSRTTLDAAAGHLGSFTDGPDISRILQRLDDQPHWKDTVVALARLADYLDAHDIPIDYQRRRRLDYSHLLPHERWLDICRRTGSPAGTGRREQIVRCQLFQRISGLPAEAAPGHRTVAEAHFRVETARFATFQTPELAAALTAEAYDFIANRHIHDEPVTWKPPAFLLDGLDLPGPDPALIDIPRLHRLVRQDEKSVQRMAEILGTSIEAVRQALTEHPAPALPPSETAEGPHQPIRMAAARALHRCRCLPHDARGRPSPRYQPAHAGDPDQPVGERSGTAPARARRTRPNHEADPLREARGCRGQDDSRERVV